MQLDQEDQINHSIIITLDKSKLVVSQNEQSFVVNVVRLGRSNQINQQSIIIILFKSKLVVSMNEYSPVLNVLSLGRSNQINQQSIIIILFKLKLLVLQNEYSPVVNLVSLGRSNQSISNQLSSYYSNSNFLFHRMNTLLQ